MYRAPILLLLSFAVALLLSVGALYSWNDAVVYGATQPTLTIDDSQTVQTGDTVVVPVSFETGPSGIASVVFSIDIDETCLDFDPTDGNSDGIPDSVVSSIPGPFSVQVTYNAGDTDGELDFVIGDYALPFAALPSLDPMVTVEFTASCVPTGSSQIAALDFSTDPPASFGDQAGQSVPGSAVDGFVTVLPTAATITIVEDSQPNSNVNFRFDGQLGTFRLDDPSVDDGDSYQQTKTFTVDPGSYRIRQQEFTAWILTAVTCTPTNVEPTLKLQNELLILTVEAGENVTCTFVNQRASEINGRKGNDLNGNGGFNTGEPWLPGWTIQLYNSENNLVDSAVTDADGRVNFKVAPGNYTLCEVEQSGWSNTKPGSINITFQQPCYNLTVAAGQAAYARFFNTQLPNAAFVAASSEEEVVYVSLPDTDEDGNYVEAPIDLWEEQTVEVHTILLPSILR